MYKPKSTSEQYRQRMSEVEELMDDLEHGEISILREMKKKELQKMDSVFHNPNWVKVRNYDERIKVLNHIYEALGEYREYLEEQTKIQKNNE
jgi:hypothetical protein